MIQTTAYARAGLLGNPSDGYHGRTISFVFKRFESSVRLSESDNVELVPSELERLKFNSVADLRNQIRKNGYYGGLRLLKSVIKVFGDYSDKHGKGDLKPFRISFESNIPQQVGLSGSSAIAIASLKALFQWNDLKAQPVEVAQLALNAEADLGISIGPQDRVIQAFEGMLFMDFGNIGSGANVDLGRGEYHRLSTDCLSGIYVAYDASSAEPTEILHNNLRQRYDSGDKEVTDTLNQISDLALAGKKVIEKGDLESLSKLIDTNFDLRQKICHLNPRHVEMVMTARDAGASAKYCGSGGAIVGVFQDLETWRRLETNLNAIGCTVFQPVVPNP